MPRGKLSVYSSFDQKEKERMMQNLLLGEQELRQGKKSCKRDNYM
jgi:hypothetical protein